MISFYDTGQRSMYRRFKAKKRPRNVLQQELMGSLGFEVEASAAAVTAPRRGGKARRRLSQDKLAVQIGVPNPQVLNRRQGQQEHGCPSYGDSRMVESSVRPQSAKLLRASSHDRVRPTSASSARPVRSSNVRGGGGAKNKDMEVLLEICRDQGRPGTVNPADFDSSISAIANLPVQQFMGAAKAGWGPYFRNLHSKMRARSTDTRMNRPPPDRRRKSGRAPSPLPRRARSGATRSSQTTSSRQYNTAVDASRQVVRNTTDSNISRSGSGASGLTRRRRSRDDGNNFDGLAASRARAAKREAEEEVIGRMAIRLQALWEELKIPSPDRAYVTAMYLEAGGRSGGTDGDWGGGLRGKVANGLGGPSAPTSIEVYHELVRQIRLLLQHRAATIQVLRAVNLRESRLADVEQALQAFQWHRGLDTDAIGAVSALGGLRDASVEVVRAVAEWRRNLWQPRAFRWQGVNYVEKMSQDAGFLRSPVGTGFLASIGLEASDMTFVLFPAIVGGGGSPVADGEDDAGREGLDAEGKAGMSTIQPPPAIVRLTPKAELVSEYRARFFRPSSAAAVNMVGAEGYVEEGGAGEGGRPQRFAGHGAVVPPTAETELESLVTQEAALQRRVETERVRLATKGCFVPLLRWLPGDNRNASSKGKRRQSFPSLPPVPPLPDRASTAPTPATHTANETGGTSAASSGVDTANGGPVAAAPLPSPALPISGALPPPVRQQQQQQEQHAPPLEASKMQGSTPGRALQEKPAEPRESGGQEGEHEEGDKDEEHEEGKEHGTNLQPAEANPGQPNQVHLDAFDRTTPGGAPFQRDSFQYTDDGLQQLQPIVVEEGSAGEAAFSRESPDSDGAEGKAGRSKSTTMNTPEDREGSSRGDARGVDATAGPSGRRQQEEDNCDGCEERSIAASACYDDDFEDDACLSDSTGKEGGSRGHPKEEIDAPEEKGNRSTTLGVASSKGANKALHETHDAFSGGEGFEVALVRDTAGLDESQRQQQLLEERESAVVTATRRIQKSARAWLRRRQRHLEEEQADLEEQHAEQQGEEGPSAKKEEESQEWLYTWRAERESQVRQTQMRRQYPEAIEDGEDAPAIRIQTVVRGHIASNQANELRRRSDARRLAAATKIQAFVRFRRRHAASKTNHPPLVEGSDHQQVAGLNRHAKAVEGEKTPSPVPADLGSGEAAARETRATLAIQKAMRRAASRRRLYSEHRSDKIDESPSTEANGHQEVPGDDQGQPSEGQGASKPDTVLSQGGGDGDDTAATLSQERQNVPGDEPGQPSEGKEVPKPDTIPYQGGVDGDGAAAALSQERAVMSVDGLYPSSSSELDRPRSSTSSSGVGSIDVSSSDDGIGDIIQHDEIRRQGTTSGGGEDSGDVSRVRPDAEDPSSVEVDQTSTESPLEDRKENSPTADADEDVSESRKPGESSTGQDCPRLPSTAGPGGDEINDTSSDAMPVDTDVAMNGMMTTTVVGAASLGASVVGLSPVPERQVFVAVASAAASEYGSEDLDFDALSSSPASARSSGSGGQGSRRGAGSTTPVEVAAASLASTTGQASAIVADAEKKLPAENSQDVKGLGTAGAAEGAEVVGAGGSSDDSSLMSLSVSSGS